jgi:hypothetical protein
MCQDCEERRLYAIEHATVADVLRVERMTAEQQVRAISGVSGLLYDDIHEQGMEEGEKSAEEAMVGLFRKEVSPLLGSAVEKLRDVKKHLETLDEHLDAEQVQDAIDLIERCPRGFMEGTL